MGVTLRVPRELARGTGEAMTATVCYGHCEVCQTDWSLGCVVPCPLDVIVAALRCARCPSCGERSKVVMHETGWTPP